MSKQISLSKNDYNTCIDILKKVKSIVKKTVRYDTIGGDKELIEHNLIKSESFKIGFDYSLIYTLDNNVLKKYITL